MKAFDALVHLRYISAIYATDVEAHPDGCATTYGEVSSEQRRGSKTRGQGDGRPGGSRQQRRLRGWRQRHPGVSRLRHRRSGREQHLRRGGLSPVERPPAHRERTGGHETPVTRVPLHAPGGDRRAAQPAQERRRDGRHAHVSIPAGALRPGVRGKHADRTPAQGLPPAGPACGGGGRVRAHPPRR